MKIMTIVTPKDIIWGEINSNDILKKIIKDINALLINTSDVNNSITYEVKIESELSNRDYSLLRFAFKEFGWNIYINKYKLDNIINYVFKISIINPIYL